MTPSSTPGDASPETAPAAERVLEVVDALANELHPDRKRPVRAALDSSLDRDLGFDSLGRAELLLRLERAFKVQLSEDLLAAAETPGDMLRAVLVAAPRAADEVAPRPASRPELEVAAAAPAAIGTLSEVLEWHAKTHPERPHILLAEDGGGERTITYGELAGGARAVAAGLVEWGLKPGERAAIMLPTGQAFFLAFFGVLYAGGIPVPIYPPVRPSQIEDHLRRQAAILDNAGAAILITVPEARRLALFLESKVASLRSVETVKALHRPGPGLAPAAVRPEDIAFLQYTSGSTGDPKGVVLTHANLLANVRAMGWGVEVGSSDVFVSWLPLYHDMGLIGAWFGSLYYAMPVVIMSPLAFLARPVTWLWAIHRHRATITASPNFGFELCLRRIEDGDIEGLDLSSLHTIANGAEPVSPDTLRRFIARFRAYGLKPEAVSPVYGLAENSVGLAFPPRDRPPLIDRIDREALTSRGEAVPAADDDPAALEVVACGRPLPGHEIRVVDATGHELGERREGWLQFRGPSATSGYYRNEARTRDLFDGEWLQTGDLAYIAGGDLYFTGRVKDIIIRAGRNIYPAEVEEAVGNVEGVRKGCVAVFGSLDPNSGTERIIVLAETRDTDRTAREALRRRIADIATEILQTPPDEVVLAPPHTVLKTSSGKIRRAASRELYETGRIGARQRAVWWQFARLVWGGFAPRLRRALRAPVEILYAAYWWLVIGATAIVLWPLVVLLPRRSWRWGALRWAARTIFRLTATPLSVEGLNRLPPGQGVLVANHASYVDGLALAAALPGELTFVAKRELARQVIAGPFLRRLGTVFVERFDAERGVEDTRKVLATAQTRQRLVFFPEGTLSRAPGLMPFRLGAFLVAAEAGMTVTPVTLRGTRSVLRGDQWFPRRGALEVHVGPPLAPPGRDWVAAIRLRDAARAEILGRCGEPDLAAEHVSY